MVSITFHHMDLQYRKLKMKEKKTYHCCSFNQTFLNNIEAIMRY